MKCLKTNNKYFNFCRGISNFILICVVVMVDTDNICLECICQSLEMCNLTFRKSNI